MINWKNKYLEMKLKYINAKQKVGGAQRNSTSSSRGASRRNRNQVPYLTQQRPQRPQRPYPPLPPPRRPFDIKTNDTDLFSIENLMSIRQFRTKDRQCLITIMGEGHNVEHNGNISITEFINRMINKAVHVNRKTYILSEIHDDPLLPLSKNLKILRNTFPSRHEKDENIYNPQEDKKNYLHIYDDYRSEIIFPYNIGYDVNIKGSVLYSELINNPRISEQYFNYNYVPDTSITNPIDMSMMIDDNTPNRELSVYELVISIFPYEDMEYTIKQINFISSVLNDRTENEAEHIAKQDIFGKCAYKLKDNINELIQSTTRFIRNNLDFNTIFTKDQLSHIIEHIEENKESKSYFHLGYKLYQIFKSNELENHKRNVYHLLDFMKKIQPLCLDFYMLISLYNLNKQYQLNNIIIFVGDYHANNISKILEQETFSLKQHYFYTLDHLSYNVIDRGGTNLYFLEEQQEQQEEQPVANMIPNYLDGFI
tara:strand:+ start:185 stop:1630 length:1446 start_codon:yes stop_codon:yes gene_type:complete